MGEGWLEDPVQLDSTPTFGNSVNGHAGDFETQQLLSILYLLHDTGARVAASLGFTVASYDSLSAQSLAEAAHLLNENVGALQ